MNVTFSKVHHNSINCSAVPLQNYIRIENILYQSVYPETSLDSFYFPLQNVIASESNFSYTPTELIWAKVHAIKTRTCIFLRSVFSSANVQSFYLKQYIVIKFQETVVLQCERSQTYRVFNGLNSIMRYLLPLVNSDVFGKYQIRNCCQRLVVISSPNRRSTVDLSSSSCSCHRGFSK